MFHSRQKKFKISSKDLGQIICFMWIGRKQAQATYESKIWIFFIFKGIFLKSMFTTSEEKKKKN